MQDIKDLKSDYLILLTLALCKVSQILLGLILDPAGFDFITYLKDVGALIYAIMLIPLVLISLKVMKSYLALAVLSACACVAITIFYIGIHGAYGLTSEVGGKILVDSKGPTIWTWVWVAGNPFFLTSLISLYLHGKNFFKKAAAE